MSIDLDITGLRENYRKGELNESGAAQDALLQFRLWFQEAVKSKVPEPNAMQLATVDESGRPHIRTVLLKEIQDSDFIFFTNYDSAKGRHIASNPHVALQFVWLELERQIRISGLAEKISPADSDAYFEARPEASKLGAWASPQSRPITKLDLLRRDTEYKEKFGDRQIPRPQNWGGYRVIPSSLEFWQGRPSRLHDRLLYTIENNEWKITRLAP